MEKCDTFGQKYIFWLKNYILFKKKLHTFQPKNTYFSKKYILFIKKIYTFQKIIYLKVYDFQEIYTFKYMIFYLGSFKYQKISGTLY